MMFHCCCASSQDSKPSDGAGRFCFGRCRSIGRSTARSRAAIRRCGRRRGSGSFVFTPQMPPQIPAGSRTVSSHGMRILPASTQAAAYQTADSSSAGMVFEGCDVVLDCLDSISSRRELNRWCVSNRKILVHAGISGMQGQLTVVVPGRTPCLECLYGRVKEADGPTPSMGAAVMHFGSAEALQAIMVLTGVGDPLIGRMLTSDLSVPSYEVLDVCSDPGCPVCGNLRNTEHRSLSNISEAN